jgi:hypothetical protein
VLRAFLNYSCNMFILVFRLYKLNPKFRLFGGIIYRAASLQFAGTGRRSAHTTLVASTPTTAKGGNVREPGVLPNDLKSRFGYYQKEYHLN